MPLKQSLYELAETRKHVPVNKGFDYKGQIFKRSMSNFLFRDEMRVSILEKMEDVMYELIERVKTIKNHFNYIVPKNYRHKN